MVSLRTRVRPIVGRIAAFAGVDRIYRRIGVGVCCRRGLGQLKLWGQRGGGRFFICIATTRLRWSWGRLEKFS